MNEVRVELTLSLDDWENLPLAMGYAIGVLSRDEQDRLLSQHAMKRLSALAQGILLATVRILPEDA